MPAKNMGSIQFIISSLAQTLYYFTQYKVPKIIETVILIIV